VVLAPISLADPWPWLDDELGRPRPAPSDIGKAELCTAVGDEAVYEVGKVCDVSTARCG